MFYVYILRCADGSLYTGMTSDPRRRFQEHCTGNRGARYTRMCPPKEIAALWETDTRRAAACLERRIKDLKRAQKLALLDDRTSAKALLSPELSASVYSVPQKDFAEFWPVDCEKM